MEKQNFFSNYSLQSSVNSKANLLTKSLLWMSLGLAFIILVAWVSSTNQTFLDFVIRVSYGWMWIVAWVLNIFIILGLFFTLRSNKIPIIVPVILYAIFAFYEGFFITSIMAVTGTVDIIKDLILYMLIPAGIFAIMGMIGYFNLINFTKLMPYTIFGFIGLLVLGLVLLFTSSRVIEALYIFLASLIFIIWIGFDLQMILRTQKSIDSNSSSLNKKEVNKIAFMYGINLFIDFVNLLWIVLRIFRS